MPKKIKILWGFTGVLSVELTTSKKLQVLLNYIFDCIFFIIYGHFSIFSGFVGDKSQSGLKCKDDDNDDLECETDANSCCNPYNIHSAPVRKGLRVIDEYDSRVSRGTLTVGKYWCDTCRKVKPGEC